MRFAREAWPIVLPVLALAVSSFLCVAFLHNHAMLVPAIIFSIIGLVLLSFFRDPARRVPDGVGKVVSPADGKVLRTETLADGRKHVAIFLSVFNVHVNRVPYSGQVDNVTQIPGAYFHAGTERAEGNARVDVQAHSDHGPVAWRQVSGAIARKIACSLKSGDRVKTGDRFGLIYFGSRMDVFLPACAVIVAKPGEKVLAGESVIAEFPTKE